MSAFLSSKLPLALGALGLVSVGAFASYASGISGGRPEAACATPSAASEERPAPRALVRAEGRLVAVPGAEVAVSAEVMGKVARLHVAEGSVVAAGDALVDLASEDQAAALAEAEALLLEREAEARFAESELLRAERSRAENVVSAQEVDRARRDRDCSRARTAVARAGLSRAQAALAKTRIRASIAGTVIERRVQEGETVAPGERLLVIADLARTRVEAEVDEFDIGRLALGASAVVEAEGDRGPAVKGRLAEIPDAVLPRRLAPQDPGRASDTRVARVKITLDARAPWKLGQRVEISIEGTR